MPTLDLQKLPTVGQAQGPAPQLRLDARGAFGEQLGDAITSAGLAAEKEALAYKAHADVARVEDAETAFQRHANDELYGTSENPGGGFLQKQAKEAVADSAGVQERLRKRRDELLSGLSNEEQRQRFRQRSEGTLVQIQRQVESHAGAQAQVAMGQSFEGRRLEALSTIANGYDQPGVIARERQNLEPLVMAEAMRRGLDGAKTYPPPEGSPAAALLGAWRSDVAKTVLDRLIAEKDAARAKAFLATPLVPGKSVSEVLGVQADTYVAKIGHLSEQVEAYDLASKAIDEARDADSGRVDEVKARQAVAGAPRSVRRETHLNLESLLNTEQENWKRQVGDRWNTAKTAYLGGADGKGSRGLGAIDGETATWLRRYAPDTWKHLQDWAEADARERQSLPPTKAQELAFTSIATDLVDNPDRFAAVGGPEFEEKFMSQVAPRDRRALLGHFLQVKGQAHRPDETLPTSVMREIVETGRVAGAFPKKGNPETWGPKAATHAQVVRELLQFQADEKAAGRKVSPETWSKEIAKRFRLVEVQGTGVLGSDFRPDVVTEAEARAQPDYQGKDTRPSTAGLSPVQRKRIEKALKDGGFPPTDDFVRWWMLDEQGVPAAQNPPPARPPPTPKAREGFGFMHD